MYYCYKIDRMGQSKEKDKKAKQMKHIFYYNAQYWAISYTDVIIVSLNKVYLHNTCRDNVHGLSNNNCYNLK